MENVNTEYEYFTLEVFTGYCSGRNQYDKQCGFVRSYWRIKINYDSDAAKEQSRAKYSMKKI